HRRAAEVFADLARAHGNEPIGLEARFREAFARLRLGGEAEAAALVALAEAHPDHELTPYAWMTLVDHHQRDGDRTARDRARGELVRFPGHLQQRVLQD